MMDKGRILVIEDEPSIQDVLRDYLTAAGYEVRTAGDGLTGLTQIDAFRPDLLLLDINLPDLDGLEITRRVRGKSDLFIIMLTARTEEDDQVLGLRLGADDYVTKPFSPRALVARVDAFMRRRQRQKVNKEQLCSRHLCVDTAAREAWIPDGPHLALTYTEFNLLLELASHPGQVLDRARLLDRVWGEAFYGNDRVVDVYVGQVRRKIEDAAGVTLIQTVRGVGYKFVDEAV